MRSSLSDIVAVDVPAVEPLSVSWNYARNRDSQEANQRGTLGGRPLLEVRSGTGERSRQKDEAWLRILDLQIRYSHPV